MTYQYLNYIRKNYKIILLIFITFLLLIKTIYGKGHDKEKEIVDLSNNEAVIKEENNETTEDQFIFVDIKGAVEQPGVYKVDKDKRVVDVINLSGGLKQDADTQFINLSKKLFDEMVIVIYTKEDITDFNKNNQSLCTNDNIENLINDADIQDAKKGGSDEVFEKISLNTASLEQLVTLPKIGEAKAQTIIKYRNDNNGFKSIEELLNVNGIGQAVFEQIKDLVTL